MLGFPLNFRCENNLSIFIFNKLLYCLENIDVVGNNPGVIESTSTKEDSNKSGQPNTKKHSEKHTRFDIANVTNSASKEGGEHIAGSSNGKYDDEVQIKIFWFFS